MMNVNKNVTLLNHIYFDYNFPNGCDYTQRVENGAIAHQIAL